jgi:hypothetical protein
MLGVEPGVEQQPLHPRVGRIVVLPVCAFGFRDPALAPPLPFGVDYGTAGLHPQRPRHASPRSKGKPCGAVVLRQDGSQQAGDDEQGHDDQRALETPVEPVGSLVKRKRLLTQSQAQLPWLRHRAGKGPETPAHGSPRKTGERQRCGGERWGEVCVVTTHFARTATSP